MNKIFKVIWSKARNCYVVVSELAKSHDDDHVRRSRSGCCRKAAVLAAFALTTSLAAVPVWAADGNGNITNNEASTMTVVSRFFRKFISSASKYRNQIYGFSSSFGCSISILNRCSMSI